MKTWVKVLLGIAGFIVLSVAAGFYFTADVTKTGNEFFAAVESGDMDQAYAMLSKDFRAGTGKAELTAYLAANGMDAATDTGWSSRKRSGGRGYLTGTITTADGGSVPVEIDLVKESGQWKIYAIRMTAAPAGFGNAARGLPDENQQVALVAESMGVFVDAVAARDMTVFHDHISRLWAAQFDVSDLEKTFGAFYKFGDELQVIKTLAPVFEGPATLAENNIMVIAGHYPTSPSQLHFTLKYIYEGTGWKVIGVSSEVK